MNNVSDSIGMATMAEDGTIQLYLRAEGPGDIIGDVQYAYKKSDPRYQEILQHIGGISVGEKKPVPRWT